MVQDKLLFGLLFIVYLSFYSTGLAQSYLSRENFQKAEIEIHAEHYAEARKYLNTVLRYSKQSLPAYFLRGKTYWLDGQTEAALKDFNKTLVLDSTYSPSYFYLGISEYEKAQYENAIQYFSKAVYYNPDDALAYNYRAEVYKELDRLDLALEDYSQAINIVPNESLLYEGRGKCHLRQEAYYEAAQDFSKAIALNPGKFINYQYRAEAYFLSGDYQRAAQDLDRIIWVRDTNTPKHYFDMNALCKAQNQDYVGAIQALDEVIAQEPTAQRYAQRAKFNLEIGVVESAIYDLSKAIELDPKNYNYYQTCGELYFARKDYKNATLYLDYVIQNTEAPAELWYKRGIAHLRNQDRTLARADFIQAAQRGFPEQHMEAGAYKYAKKVYKRLSKEKKKQDIDPSMKAKNTL